MPDSLIWCEPFIETLHDASVGNISKDVHLGGKFGTLAIQLEGMAAGATPTMTFQASIDGENWVNLQGVNITTGAALTSATTDIIAIFPVAGLKYFRAAISNFSGTNTAHAVTAKIIYSAAVGQLQIT